MSSLTIQIGPAAPPVGVGYPPDLASLPNTARPTAPAVPAVRTETAMPGLATKFQRITSVNGRRHNYSKLAAWNCDGTKLLVGDQITAPLQQQLLDGSTFAVLRTFTTMVGNACWSRIDNNKMYGTWDGDNHLYAQNMTTDALTVVHTFTGYSTVSLGFGEGAVSNDDRWFALYASGATGANDVIVYDRQTDSVTATYHFGSVTPNDLSISALGNYVLIDWDQGGNGSGTAINQGCWLYDRALVNRAQLYQNGGVHFDNGLDSLGREITVTVTNGVVSYLNQLPSPVATSLFPGISSAYPSGGHISMEAFQRPGWAYLSDMYSYGGGSYGLDMLTAVKTDGSGTTEFFGWSFSSAGSYPAQPQASVSPDGKKVVYASDMGGSIYAYVVYA